MVGAEAGDGRASDPVTSGGARAATLDWQAACQLKNFLRPCLLLLLDEEPAYGYELRSRLVPFRVGSWDQGTIYRLLNSMENEGLVSSFWERSAAGPQRRRYHLTEQGRDVLGEWATTVDSLSRLLIAFNERYRRDVAAKAASVAPRPATAPSAMDAPAPSAASPARRA